VFKGKAALSIHPILPSFSKLEVCFLLDLIVFWPYIVLPTHHNFSVLLVRRVSSEQKWISNADFRAVLASYQSADIAAEFIERSKEHQRSVDIFLSSITFFLYLVDGNLNVRRQYYAVVTLYSLRPKL